MVEKDLSNLEVVGKMGMAKVYRLASGGPMWVEYQCRGVKYRSNGSDILMKQVVRKIEHFNDVPLGKFQEMIKKASDGLNGVHVIMKPSSAMNTEWGNLGGQLLIKGWTYHVTSDELLFFDRLNSNS